MSAIDRFVARRVRAAGPPTGWRVYFRGGIVHSRHSIDGWGPREVVQPGGGGQHPRYGTGREADITAAVGGVVRALRAEVGR